MKIGVLLDKPKILAGFDYTFCEANATSFHTYRSNSHSADSQNCRTNM